ncbi:MAG: hypothetical protein P8107_12175 [Spirochaetia bacterium]
MKYFLVLLLPVFMGCAGTAGVSTPGSSGAYKEIGKVKVNTSIVENAGTEDGYGNRLLRMKQNLIDTETILNMLRDYYFMFNRNGDMYINSCVVFPGIPGSQITAYSHLTRDYDGAYVDLTELSIELKGGTSVKVRLFFPYKSSGAPFSLFLYALAGREATKGYYEYGDALDALKENTVGSFKNENKVVLKKTVKTVNGITHWYLSMNPASSVYDFVTDTYSKIIIDIYSADKNSSDLEIDRYIDYILKNINYL